MPASLIITSIGYQTPRIDGVPYDERGGNSPTTKAGSPTAFMRSAGRGAGRPAPSAPTVRMAMRLLDKLQAMPPGSDGGKRGGEGLAALLGERGINSTSFEDWRSIEAAEVAAARPGSPREKFVRQEDWLKILGR